MNHQLLFLSYSRAQFYFAESLAVTLQWLDLNVWFDVQRLTPGSDWQSGIEQGLSGCDGLILVASRAALQSPFVQAEWADALEKQKPIYVVVFEAAEIPPELLQKAAALVDMRRDFETGVKRLVGSLTHDEQPRDRIPKPNLLGLPDVLAPEVRRLSWALAGHGLIYLLAGTSMADFNFWSAELIAALFDRYTHWTPTLISFACGIGLLWLRWRFLQRKITYQPFRFITFLPFLYFGIMLVSALIASSLNLAGLVIALLATIMLIILVTRTNPLLATVAVLRWMPMGAASPDLRRNLNTGVGSRLSRDYGKVMPQNPGQLYGAGRKIRYRLYHASPDAAIANSVQRSMEIMGHKRVEEGEADHDLLLITGHTDPQQVAELVNRAAALTPILAAQTSLKRFPGLERFQIVDFRNRDRRVTAALATSMGYSTQDATSYIGGYVTPRSFVQQISPSVGTRYQELREVSPFLRALSAERIALAALLLVVVLGLANQLTAPPRPVSTINAPVPTQPIGEMVGTQAVSFAQLLQNQGTSGVLDNLHYVLPLLWDKFTIASTTTLNEPFKSLAADYGEDAVPLGIFDSPANPGGAIHILTLQYTEAAKPLAYLLRFGEITSPKQVVSGDDQLMINWVGLPLRNIGSTFIGREWVFVVEAPEKIYLLHVLGERGMALTEAPPPAVMAFIGGLTIVNP